MATRAHQIKVLHYVWWKNGHINKLLDLMNSRAVVARQSKALLPTSLLRILVAPFSVLLYRALGYRIIHLHWVAGHFRPAQTRSELGASFYYLWFRIFLRCAHALGLKIVWTAHNVLPHDKVFPNDGEARKYLISHVDRVFALNQTSAGELHRKFNAQNVVTIPVAEVIPEPSKSREVTRAELGLIETDILFSHFGHIRRYKGTDKFLSAMSGIDEQAKFLVAGTPGPIDYMQSVHKLRAEAILAGIPLIYKEGFLLDDELANLIQASDFIVCPFDSINNSGFVNIAFAMGKPVILSNIPGLAWVPRNAAIWIEPSSDAVGLSQTLQNACRLTTEQVATITSNAKDYIQNQDWDAYVSAQVSVYEELVQ